MIAEAVVKGQIGQSGADSTPRSAGQALFRIVMSRMWGPAALHMICAKVDTCSAPMHRRRLVTMLNTDTRCLITALRHKGSSLSSHRTWVPVAPLLTSPKAL
jgi:hypothetical protein